MNFDYVIFISLVLVFFLDLIVMAARSGLRNATLVRLLQLRDENVNTGLPIKLVNASPRPYAALFLAQTACRFLLIGVIFLIILGNPEIGVTSWSIFSLVILGLVIAWAEWTVERAVGRDPEKWVIRLRYFIQGSTWVFYPLMRLSILFSRDSTGTSEPAGVVTEDELRTMVEAGQQDGILEQEERQMIYSIFQLGDTLTREIMVPRIEMLALDINTHLPDALDALLESGYSRVPIYEERVDNVIGILYAKELLKVWREDNGQGDSIRSLLREPYFVPEAKKVDELLAEMQHRRVHMAIVVDEYGGVAGVVTLEDIIEEILGEIQDEYDEEDLPYQAIDDGSYLFRGRIDLDDFNQIMESDLPPIEADTLGGFIYSRLGHVPVTGESVRVDDLNLIVEQVSNRRIRKVRANRVPKNEEIHADGKKV